MLDAIEEVHDRGFIHRDVKAVSLPTKFKRVFLEYFKIKFINFYAHIITTFDLNIKVFVLTKHAISQILSSQGITNKYS